MTRDVTIKIIGNGPNPATVAASLSDAFRPLLAQQAAIVEAFMPTAEHAVRMAEALQPWAKQIVGWSEQMAAAVAALAQNIDVEDPDVHDDE